MTEQSKTGGLQWIYADKGLARWASSRALPAGKYWIQAKGMFSEHGTRFTVQDSDSVLGVDDRPMPESYSKAQQRCQAREDTLLAEQAEAEEPEPAKHPASGCIHWNGTQCSGVAGSDVCSVDCGGYAIIPPAVTPPCVHNKPGCDGHWWAASCTPEACSEFATEQPKPPAPAAMTDERLAEIDENVKAKGKALGDGKTTLSYMESVIVLQHLRDCVAEITRLRAVTGYDVWRDDYKAAATERDELQGKLEWAEKDRERQAKELTDADIEIDEWNVKLEAAEERVEEQKGLICQAIRDVVHARNKTWQSAIGAMLNQPTAATFDQAMEQLRDYVNWVDAEVAEPYIESLDGKRTPLKPATDDVVVSIKMPEHLTRITATEWASMGQVEFAQHMYEIGKALRGAKSLQYETPNAPTTGHRFARAYCLMLEGKSVRRPGWPEGKEMHIGDDCLIAVSLEPTSSCRCFDNNIDDIMATDWYVVEGS